MKEPEFENFLFPLTYEGPVEVGPWIFAEPIPGSPAQNGGWAGSFEQSCLHLIMLLGQTTPGRPVQIHRDPVGPNALRAIVRTTALIVSFPPFFFSFNALLMPQKSETARLWGR